MFNYMLIICPCRIAVHIKYSFMCERDYYISYIYKYKIRHVELTQKLLLSTIQTVKR